MSQRVLETLSEAECLELIGNERVGRFVFQDADGVAALPVNYGLAGREIVFRTEKSSHLRDVLLTPIAFEIDHTDLEAGKGWSVLIRGTAREIGIELIPEIILRTGKAFPQPWAEGIHNVWIAVSVTKVTGRRLSIPYQAVFF